MCSRIFDIDIIRTQPSVRNHPAHKDEITHSISVTTFSNRIGSDRIKISNNFTFSFY
jgi:hypothetical protein